MAFEYDPAKSLANKLKHGLDFEEAEVLSADPRLVEVPALTVDEPRFLAIGRIGGRHWTAVFTWRRSSIRIISVRRSRSREIEHYEGP